MSNYFIFAWIAVFIVMLIIEFATVQLTTVWFAVGAFAALLISALGVNNIVIQIIVFLLVSLVALIVTRPLVKKMINRKTVPTNSDRCIGAEAIVTEEINNLLSKGLVKVNGIEWTARSEKNEIIPINTKVIIKRIDGVKVYVE